MGKPNYGKQSETYWIVNLATKQYCPIDNATMDFFDGDWKQKTPFRESGYIDLTAQRVRDDQRANDHLFYNYDLCADGMIVGIYADMDHVDEAQIDRFLSELKGKQDVASAFIHRLTRANAEQDLAVNRDEFHDFAQDHIDLFGAVPAEFEDSSGRVLTKEQCWELAQELGLAENTQDDAEEETFGPR